MPIGQDNSGRESGGPGKSLPLPTLLSITARRVTEKVPRRFVTNGKEYSTSEVIHVDVETSEPFPIAGTGPALFVGNVVLTDSEGIGTRKYRFYTPATAKLENGAPIALGRAGSGIPKREQTSKLRFKFE
jgi:hypothetical protein